MAKSAAPAILVTKTKAGLKPFSGYDEELFASYPPDTLFVLKPEARRSGKLHRTYWSALSRIVKATGSWATPEKLHEKTVIGTGYFTIDFKADGTPYIKRDSIAYAEMPSDAQFKPYFDAAMAWLAEEIGVDPLEFLKEQQR